MVALIVIGAITTANEKDAPAGPRSARCTVSQDAPSVVQEWLSEDKGSDADVVAVWDLTAAEGKFTVAKLENDVVLTFFNEPFGAGSTTARTVDSVTSEWSYFRAATSVTTSSPGYAEARSCGS